MEKALLRRQGEGSLVYKSRSEFLQQLSLRTQVLYDVPFSCTSNTKIKTTFILDWNKLCSLDWVTQARYTVSFTTHGNKSLHREAQSTLHLGWHNYSLSITPTWQVTISQLLTKAGTWGDSLLAEAPQWQACAAPYTQPHFPSFCLFPQIPSSHLEPYKHLTLSHGPKPVPYQA